MLPIIFSALIGGPVTAALLWEHGAAVAILAAPLGGSLAALCAAALNGFQSMQTEVHRPCQTGQVYAYFSPTWTAPAHC
jgi:hypothetical protein